ncbi:MAG: hypothetical protein IJ456_08260, partial [Bacteroides sp.]|nr:hypothetical protein [Bacteroides sp.]
TAANRKSQFQIMCLAFDPGNVYGQTRIGTGSVTERVCIRFNWNASTTIQKGKELFSLGAYGRAYQPYQFLYDSRT